MPTPTLVFVECTNWHVNMTYNITYSLEINCVPVFLFRYDQVDHLFDIPVLIVFHSNGISPEFYL